jgi:hypothetical protein
VNFFPIQGLKEFSLIVSVGRCKYRLSEHSIGFILQATLGGVAADFRPQQISDWVFKFVVASRNVGFTFIICDISLVSNTRYILIFRAMVVQIGFQKQRDSLKRKSVNGAWFLTGKPRTLDHMQKWSARGPFALVQTGCHLEPQGPSTIGSLRTEHQCFRESLGQKKDMWIIAIGLLRRRTWIFRSPVKVQSEISGAFKLRIPGPRGSNQ